MKLRMFEPKVIHTQAFRLASLPPTSTPDLALLRQQEYWYVFDWANIANIFPVTFWEAYSVPKFYMYQCIHERGTPVIVFNKQVDERYNTVPARLRGKIHLVTPKDIVDIDRRQANGVHCVRKLIRVMLPHFFVDPRPDRYSPIRPATCLAWVYMDNIYPWREIFEYDYSIWRNKGGYVPMTQKSIWLDSRGHVGRYYVPTAVKQVHPKYNSTIQHYSDFKIRVRQEDDFMENGLKDAQERLKDNNPPRKMSQLS